MKKEAKQKYTSIGGQALIEGILMRSADRSAFSVRHADGSIETLPLQEKRIKDKLPFLGWPVIRGAVNMVESMILGSRALMKSAAVLEEDIEQEEAAAGDADGDISSDAAVSVAITMEEPGFAAEGEAEAAVEADIAETIETAAEAAAIAETAVISAPEPTAAEAEAEAVSELFEEPEASQPMNETAAISAPEEKKSSSALWGVIMTLSMVLGVAIAMVLFIWLPTLLFNWINGLADLRLTAFKALFEGTLKMALFVLYLFAVSLMKDIKRVFSYHGAEHKTIFCYEAKKELTVENVRSFKRFHPRCGTSFMILILIVSVVFSSCLLLLFPALRTITALWIAVKILSLPLLCGLGFELIRFCGKFDNILTRIISAPGMWVQRLTTKEPDDSMIEVAITALNAVKPDGEDIDARAV